MNYISLLQWKPYKNFQEPAGRIQKKREGGEKKSGSAAIVRPRWIYFDLMGFLDLYIEMDK